MDLLKYIDYIHVYLLLLDSSSLTNVEYPEKICSTKQEMLHQKGNMLLHIR